MDFPKELFDSISDYAAIQKLCDDHREEDLYVEFKTLKNPDQPFSESDDKRLLAKILSAFGNSDGGVVVWGIQSGKRDQSAFASEIKPISAKNALARLNDLAPTLVSPCVDGVLHKAIESENGGGVALTYIPASDKGPHMAKAKDSWCFYKRSGSTTYPMEWFDIADMFGRRQRPNLMVRIHDPIAGSDNCIDVSTLPNTAFNRFTLKIDNNGRAMARWIMLQMWFPQEMNGMVGRATCLNQYKPEDSRWLLSRDGSEIQIKFEGGSSCVVHVGDDLLIGRMDATPNDFQNVVGRAFELKYKLCCEGMQIKDGVLEFKITNSTI